ncbi:MAG: M15 family metallopeptidase [Parcubacteria group bacterium]
MKKVLAAGTFDLLHPGHIWFLTQAKKLGDHLTVIVARDVTVKKVKGIAPHQMEHQRAQALRNLGIADQVVIGGKNNKLLAIKKVRPDIICLGYDQRAFTGNLRIELARLGFFPEIVRMKAYRPDTYKSSFMRAAGLVDVHTLDPTLVLDVKYATRSNFVGKKMYNAPRAFLRHEVADRLIRANQLLRRQGYRIKLWDCYRPLDVQKILWNKKPDPQYVANPREGSMHNRGAAIDCTMVDINGKELPMPTPFDTFSKRAHRNNHKHTATQKKYVLILERAMKRVGFVPFPTEWWHFHDPNWKKYPLLNLPL